jgi:hypothetical protein
MFPTRSMPPQLISTGTSSASRSCRALDTRRVVLTVNLMTAESLKISEPYGCLRRPCSTCSGASRIERVTIQDEVPRLLQEAVYAIGEVPSDLSHPSFAWLTGDPCDMYPSCCNIDNEEYVVANQPEAPQHLDREEVSAGDGSKVRLNEGVPACTTPAFWRGFRRWASVHRMRLLPSCSRSA